MEAFASLGLRVLALASNTFEAEYNEGVDIDRNAVETNLTFPGLIGLYDPPRPESAYFVNDCQQAGIIVYMLTGDHPSTARAIAAQVGILPPNLGELSKPTSLGCHVHDGKPVRQAQR